MKKYDKIGGNNMFYSKEYMIQKLTTRIRLLRAAGEEMNKNLIAKAKRELLKYQKD